MTTIGSNDFMIPARLDDGELAAFWIGTLDGSGQYGLPVEMADGDGLALHRVIPVTTSEQFAIPLLCADGELALFRWAATTTTTTGNTCSLFICTSGTYTTTCQGYTINPPGVDITVTFSGGGTVNLFGETWSSGETKHICPTAYDCDKSTVTSYTGTLNYDREYWAYVGGPTLKLSNNQNQTVYSFGAGGVSFTYATSSYARKAKSRYAHGLYPPSYTVSTRLYTMTNTSSAGVSAFTVSPGLGKTIQNGSFGSVTTAGGITISWARGTDSWNTCSI
jgi:hypothetical protein